MPSTEVQMARRSELPTHAKKLQLGRKKKNTCCFKSEPKTTGRFARQPCENSQLRTPTPKKNGAQNSRTPPDNGAHYARLTWKTEVVSLQSLCVWKNLA